MKYILFTLLCMTLVPVTAFAEQTAPEAPLERIKWAMECCGDMPEFMLVGFVLLAAMIIITILVAKMKGADADEQ